MATHRSLVKKKCRNCLKTYSPFYTAGKRGYYCSRKCFEQDHKAIFVTLTCFQCSKEFKRDESYHRFTRARRTTKRVFCSKYCFTKNNRTDANPLRRQAGELRYHHSSKHWRGITAAHLKKEPNCAVCGKKAAATDHIIPFSAIAKYCKGADPDAEVNRMSLCRTDHGTKTGADRHLFRGDGLRFMQNLVGWPLERVYAAGSHYGFSLRPRY